MRSIVKNYLNNKEQKKIEKYTDDYKNEYGKILKECEEEYYKIMEKYFEIGNSSKNIFNYNLNVSFHFVENNSLASKLGVEKMEVLKTKKEIDNYFGSINI